MTNTHVWLYKWNSRGRFHEGRERDWTNVFKSAAEFTGYGFRNPVGRRVIAEVKPGDLMVAYQTDSRAAIGICEVRAVEHERGEPYLRFMPRYQFPAPVKLHDRKRSDDRLRQVGALRQGPVQSLYRLSPAEATAVLEACGLSSEEVGRLLA